MAESSPTLPPGLSCSDVESGTASRERRRVAVAAREITAALTQNLMDKFDMLETKLDRRSTYLASHPPLGETKQAQACLIIPDDIQTRIYRLELLRVPRPYRPTLSNVLTSLGLNNFCWSRLLRRDQLS